jgi:replicative DNA helicase
METAIAALPPHSVELEEAVIGCILQSQDALLRIIDDLPTEAFFVSLHREIFEVARNLHESRLTPDLHAIASKFKDEREKLSQIAQICQKTVVIENVETYAAIVFEKYNRRRLIELGQKAIAMAHDLTTEWEEINERVEEDLTAIATGRQKEGGLVHVQEILAEIYFDLEKAEETDAISTGIDKLDGLLSGGFRPQEVTILAAATGLGKSQFLNNVAYSVAASTVRQSLNSEKPVEPVVIFSMEMSSKAMIRRILSMDTEIPLSKIVSKRLSQSETERIINGVARIGEFPLYVDDTPGDTLTLGKIASECHKIKREYGSIGLVCVDYLQMFGDRNSGQRHGEVAKYSQGLLNLSKRLDCHVLALAQINQAVDARNNKRPTLADLGESGKIKQDANTVIFLYREDYYSSEKSYEDEVPMELIVAKNRNGPCETVGVFFNKPTGRIRCDRPSQNY